MNRSGHCVLDLGLKSDHEIDFITVLLKTHFGEPLTYKNRILPIRSGDNGQEIADIKSSSCFGCWIFFDAIAMICPFKTKKQPKIPCEISMFNVQSGL